MHDITEILRRSEVWVSTAPPGWGLDRLPASVHHRTFHSQAMNREVGYCIYLPPSYTGDPQRHYPCIVHLHGGGGTETSDAWFARWYDAMYQAGRVPEAVIVFPNGLKWSAYADAKNTMLPVHSMIAVDLIREIQATYRVCPQGPSWIVQGHSMGGGGALLYFLKYPHLFRSVLCLAPAFPQGRRVTEWALRHLYEDDLEYAKLFQPWYVLQTAPAMDASREIMLCMGKNDVQGLQDNCQIMYQALLQKGLGAIYHKIDKCGHDLWQLITLNESELVGYYRRHLGDSACQKSEP